MNGFLCGVFLIGITSFNAFAAVSCTTEPASKWISLPKAQEWLNQHDYITDSLKLTWSGCYEFYGLNQDNERVIVYFNAVTMDIVTEENEDD